MIGNPTERPMPGATAQGDSLSESGHRRSGTRYAWRMQEIGITGLIVILVVALLVFGPKRLPEIGRSLGKGMREFKDSISGRDDKPELQASSSDETPSAK